MHQSGTDPTQTVQAQEAPASKGRVPLSKDERDGADPTFPESHPFRSDLFPPTFTADLRR